MPVEQGDTVKVNYEGRLDNGEIFDTSQHGEHNHPLEFTVGEHQVIKGFEEGVLGMEIDDEKNIFIQPKDDINKSTNTEFAIGLCQARPIWRLSIQTHKLLGIL